MCGKLVFVRGYRSFTVCNLAEKNVYVGEKKVDDASVCKKGGGKEILFSKLWSLITPEYIFVVKGCDLLYAENAFMFGNARSTVHVIFLATTKNLRPQVEVTAP